MFSFRLTTWCLFIAFCFASDWFVLFDIFYVGKIVQITLGACGVDWVLMCCWRMQLWFGLLRLRFISEFYLFWLRAELSDACFMVILEFAMGVVVLLWCGFDFLFVNLNVWVLMLGIFVVLLGGLSVCFVVIWYFMVA